MSVDLQPWEEWRQYADEDYLAAKILLEAGEPANPICFHAYQLAEKYLKCYLSFAQKRFEKRHQLDYLLELCQAEDLSFAELITEIEYLADFYTETRYPGDLPTFTLTEGREALAQAEKVRMFVLAKVNNHHTPQQ